MTTLTKRLHTGLKMTLDEFLSLGETDRRLELDHGTLYLMPSPTKDHQFILQRLGQYICLYLDSLPEPPSELYQDITTILSRDHSLAVEPDLAVILAGRADLGGIAHLEGVPDLIVEILSTDRARDLVRKRQLYAEAGVREYWIVDPQSDTVTPLELNAGRYQARPTHTPADTLTTPLLPGLQIPLAAIFTHRQRPPRP